MAFDDNAAHSADEIIDEMRRRELAKQTAPEFVIVTAFFEDQAKSGSFPETATVGDIMVWAQTINADVFGRGKTTTKIVIASDDGRGWTRQTEAAGEPE